MFHVVLFEPEIPGNAGNVIRLCANTGATLHMVRPLGFKLDDKSLRRSGLDYHALAAVNIHDDLPACLRDLRGAREMLSCSVLKRAGCLGMCSPKSAWTIACIFPCGRGIAASIYPMPSRSSCSKPGVNPVSAAATIEKICGGSRRDERRASCESDAAGSPRFPARSARRWRRSAARYFRAARGRDPRGPE